MVEVTRPRHATVGLAKFATRAMFDDLARPWPAQGTHVLHVDDIMISGPKP